MSDGPEAKQIYLARLAEQAERYDDPHLQK